MMDMGNGPEDAYTSPSFNSYSSQRLAEIVGKENQDTSDEEFEFPLAREEKDVYKGQTGPVFPVFCRDLLSSGLGSSAEEVERIEVPLSKLLEKSRRDDGDLGPGSCSSSEADELESIPAGTYCVWRPKVLSETPSPSRCKKSRSTGSSSKRWKLPEFLRRSNSEGKDSVVIMTPKHRDKAETSKKSTGKIAGTSGPPSAHEALYVQNRAKKENDRKKSYLPYRPDLLGLFASANSCALLEPNRTGNNQDCTVNLPKARVLSDFIEDWVKICLPAKKKVIAESPFGDQCALCEKARAMHKHYSNFNEFLGSVICKRKQ